MMIVLQNRLKSAEEGETKHIEDEEEELQELHFKMSLRRKLEQFNYETPVEDHKEDEIPKFPKRTLLMRRNATFEANPGLVKDCLKEYIRRNIIDDF